MSPINDALSSLSDWFNVNYLTINPDKTQALVLGHSNYEFALRIDNASVSVSAQLKILGVTLDKKLAFKEHISLQLEKGLQNDSSTEKITSLSPVRNYEKALQGISSTVRLLYGIGNGQSKRMEDANVYSFLFAQIVLL